MRKPNNSPLAVRLPLIIAVAVIAGIFIGATMLEPSAKSEGLSASLSKFKDVLTSIDRYYVDEVESNELVESAIREMLKNLDPHSAYIPKEEVERLNAQLKGSYDGIGVQFDILHDTVYVIKAIDGGPSKALGIKTGDKIVIVEGENIAGIGIKNKGVTDRLLGAAGSEVKVTILRNGSNLEFTIKRGQISQQTIVASYMVDVETGYIKISRFGAKTYDEFVAALAKLKEKGMTRLVIDLQGNGGGLMSAAERISDELIEGKRLLVSQKSSHKQYTNSFYAKIDGIFEEGPVIVLVDEYSASASEIVSGALQDHDRALIVGRRTFGKGLVQMPISLNDKSEMRLTIARYYTPSGRSIQKPYSNIDDYNKELSERYDHGEFFNQDSIKFNDSLKFETSKGRTVYGGGGIMPDHFVPYDTSAYSTYYRQLLSKRIVREFTLKYFLANENDLLDMNFSDFNKNFRVSDKMVKELIAIGDEGGVSYDEDGYRQSKLLLRTFMKAEIASLIWGEQGFYPVMNPVSNEAYNRALKLFDEAILLAEAYNE